MDQAKLHEFEARCIQEEPAACVAACPLHVDARSFVIAVAAGAWTEAWKVLRKIMPLPAVLGRICDHPCEAACRRAERGDAIRIGALERVCVSTPAPEQRLLPLPRKAVQVAVLGSGLSGLTAAFDLARKGYPVTVFDEDERLGGPLLGFPEDLVPRAALDAELAWLGKLGVEFRTRERPDPGVALSEFRAVFVADGDASAWAALELSGEKGEPLEEKGVFVARSPAGTEASPVWWAFGGRQAAISIDRYVQGASLTAGREKEGPQRSRLFVSLKGVEPTAAVVPAQEANGYTTEEAGEEAARCLRCECLECVKVCEYLEHFGGYPRRYAREVYNNAAIVQGEHKANLLINSCSLCDLCTSVCPLDFSMSTLCLEARRDMVRRGKMPPSAHEFALEDYAWSHGESFALARPAPDSSDSAYVFFPGCQLAGSDPGHVEAVYAYLRERLTGGVGLMLDCCGAPLYWAGREDMFGRGLADIQAHVRRLGAHTVIFACPTCLELLEPRLEAVKSLFLTQVLEEQGLPADGPRADLPLRALHDPCTSRHNPEVQESVRRVLSQIGQPVEEPSLSRGLTVCCGYGGLQANANPGLGKAVASRRAGETACEYVTYCAMCRDSLAAVGKEAVHILDLVFPRLADPGSRRRPGWSERRENRARLKGKMLAELWGEGGRVVQPWQEVRLFIPDDVQGLLEERRILVEDVQQVIHHAEQTGEKLCHSVSGHFLACYRPRSVTFWVEYSPREDGFVVHNAYGHRMTAELGV